MPHRSIVTVSGLAVVMLDPIRLRVFVHGVLTTKRDL
jgi:hypothetical protein